MVPLHLLLAVPAGSALALGTARLVRKFGGAASRRRSCRPRLVRRPGRGGRDHARDVTLHGRAAHGPASHGCRTSSRDESLVRWFRDNTDASARILFEDQLRLYEETDPESTHWTTLLPFLLERDARQFIGGEYQLAFIRHHQFASFGDFQLGGRPIDLWTPDELRDYCNLYNIGWVVCWSPLSKFCFDQWEPGASGGDAAAPS